MKFAKRLLMLAGAVALAGLLSVMLAPKAVHAVVSTLVTVANGTANPVPTVAVDTRNVNVVNTPVPVTGNVNATLTGTPAVSLNGNVPVSNPADGNGNPAPLIVKDAQNPALFSFSQETIDQSGGNCRTFTNPLPLTAPNGAAVKAVVIEEISGSVIFTGAQPNWIRVVNPAGTEFFVPLQTSTNTSNDVAALAQTRLYGGPGDQFVFNIDLFDSTACSFSVSGYLVTQ